MVLYKFLYHKISKEIYMYYIKYNMYLYLKSKKIKYFFDIRNTSSHMTRPISNLEGFSYTCVQ